MEEERAGSDNGASGSVLDTAVAGARSSMTGKTQGPACPLCGSRDGEICFAVRGYDLRACHNCELFFIDPYPTDEAAVHERVVDYKYDNLQVLDANKHYATETAYYQRHFPKIAAVCQGAHSVLDVGCGTGHLLERLRTIPGLQRAGIELNAARAAKARQVAGCEIFQAPIEEFKSDTKFDVIILINVLSHIPSLDSLFSATRRLLTPNGKLVLKVGEMRRDVAKMDIVDWGIPDHIHFLGLKTMDYIAEKYRYKIVKHYRVPYSFDFFTREHWSTRGRDPFRNAVKSVAVAVPGALPAMARVHHALRGGRLYSSFIVLSPEE